MSSDQRQGTGVPSTRSELPDRRPRVDYVPSPRWFDAPTLRMLPGQRERAEAIGRRQLSDMASADARNAERRAHAAAEVRERGAGRAT
jgi:hypothetical protein